MRCCCWRYYSWLLLLPRIDRLCICLKLRAFFTMPRPPLLICAAACFKLGPSLRRCVDAESPTFAVLPERSSAAFSGVIACFFASWLKSAMKLALYLCAFVTASDVGPVTAP